MPAYLERMGGLGVKLVSSYPENPSKYGPPTVPATILYSDHRTGALLAVMEAGYITAVRTGAASGVATKYLCRKDSHTAGILGSGMQAQTQLEAICAIRHIRKVKAFSPTAAHRNAFAQSMAPKLGVEIIAVNNAADAVKGCDVVIAASA
jgi:ornithine cyclodeaminase/alanine dehydrogenase